MHPMQPYINLYVFSYITLCIYASLHPMQPYQHISSIDRSWGENGLGYYGILTF